jgi:hypothetical protein
VPRSADPHMRVGPLHAKALPQRCGGRCLDCMTAQFTSVHRGLGAADLHATGDMDQPPAAAEPSTQSEPAPTPPAVSPTTTSASDISFRFGSTAPSARPAEDRAASEAAAAAAGSVDVRVRHDWQVGQACCYTHPVEYHVDLRRQMQAAQSCNVEFCCCTGQHYTVNGWLQGCRTVHLNILLWSV